MIADRTKQPRNKLLIDRRFLNYLTIVLIYRISILAESLRMTDITSQGKVHFAIALSFAGLTQCLQRTIFGHYLTLPNWILRRP